MALSCGNINCLNEFRQFCKESVTFVKIAHSKTICSLYSRCRLARCVFCNKSAIGLQSGVEVSANLAVCYESKFKLKVCNVVCYQ